MLYKGSLSVIVAHLAEEGEQLRAGKVAAPLLWRCLGKLIYERRKPLHDDPFCSVLLKLRLQRFT